MVLLGLNSASILAQVNVGATPATFLGIFLAVAGAALYFVRNVKPDLARDHDIFFAAVGLLCGFILIFQGWRLDPILQFLQLMLVGSIVFFAYESIRLRSIATEQARRNTPIVDRERDVSDDYNYSRPRRNSRAERDVIGAKPLPYYEEEEEDYEERPRISGSREERRGSRGYNEDYYEDDTPKRSSRRVSNERNDEPVNDRPRRRNPSRSTSRSPERFDDDDWNSTPAAKQSDDWENPSRDERKPSTRRGSNGSSRPEFRDDEMVQPKPRRRRPSGDTTPRRDREDDEQIPTADYTDYVDYKPLEKPEDKPERPNTNFDDDMSIG
ncbi:Ycf66 family protein [Calothrix sp. NIES-4101]|nr:Ycf66 family protein [Calothrix sp. NIES-4101]